MNETERWPADFRISETPIFLTREFTDEVTRAAHEIAERDAHAGICAPRCERNSRRIGSA